MPPEEPQLTPKMPDLFQTVPIVPELIPSSTPSMPATHKPDFLPDRLISEQDKTFVLLPHLPGHNRLQFNNRPQFNDRPQFNNSSQF